MAKHLPANAGDAGDIDLIPGWKDPLEKGNDNPLQYSFLGNAMKRGAWQATVQRVAKSQMQLSD